MCKKALPVAFLPVLVFCHLFAFRGRTGYIFVCLGLAIAFQALFICFMRLTRHCWHLKMYSEAMESLQDDGWRRVKHRAIKSRIVKDASGPNKWMSLHSARGEIAGVRPWCHVTTRASLNVIGACLPARWPSHAFLARILRNFTGRLRSLAGRLRSIARSIRFSLHRADVYLAQIYASPEYSLSRLVRLFLWCLSWLVTAYHIYRPTNGSWWTFEELSIANLVRNEKSLPTADFWIDQTLQWTVFFDFAADLLVSRSKLAFLFSFPTLCDLITMPITSLLMEIIFGIMCYELTVEECVLIAERDPFAFSKAKCGPFDPRPRVFLNQFGFLRFATLYFTKGILQDLGSFSPRVYASLSLFLSIYSMLSFYAGFMFWLNAPTPELEYVGQPVPDGTFYYPHSYFYFAIVTITTVGYGDFSPSYGLPAGEIATIICLAVAIVWLPQQLSALQEAMQKALTIRGSVPVGKPYTLVLGDAQAEQVEFFIDHQFSVGASTFRTPMVVLTPHALEDFASYPHVTYIRGDLLSPLQLPTVAAQRLNLHRATAVFLLGDVLSLSGADAARVLVHDRATTARLLVLTKLMPPERVHVLYKSTNDLDLARSAGVRKIVCLNHLKMRLLSKSVSDCPGAIVLITNLLNTKIALDRTIASMQMRDVGMSGLVARGLGRSKGGSDSLARSVGGRGFDAQGDGGSGGGSGNSSGGDEAAVQTSGADGGDEQVWYELYALGAENNLTLSHTPSGLVGMKWGRAVETVFVHTGTILLGVADTQAQGVRLMPWGLALEQEHTCVWVGHQGATQAVGKIFDSVKATQRLTPSGMLPIYPSSAASGTAAVYVAAAQVIHDYVRHRRKPVESLLETLRREVLQRDVNHVIVCGWPRGLSSLVRRLSDNDFTVSVVAPEPVFAGAVAKCQSIDNFKWVPDSPMKEGALRAAGLLSEAACRVLIFNEGLLGDDERSGVSADCDCLLVKSQILSILTAHGRRMHVYQTRLSLIVGFAEVSAAQNEPHRWPRTRTEGPHDLTTARARAHPPHTNPHAHKPTRTQTHPHTHPTALLPIPPPPLRLVDMDS